MHASVQQFAPVDLSRTEKMRGCARVVLIDDSVAMRRMVSRALQQERKIELVGTTAVMDRAAEYLKKHDPHVALLGCHDDTQGISVLLRTIRKAHPDLPILLLTRGACNRHAISDSSRSAPMEILAAPDVDTSGPDFDLWRNDLIRVLTRLDSRRTNDVALDIPRRADVPSPDGEALVSAATLHAPSSPLPTLSVGGRSQRSIFVVGSSTGGPDALSQLFATVPLDFPLPIVITQHMPPIFTRMLADRLRSQTGFNVQEGTHGMLVEAGKAIVAPGNYHLRLVNEAGEVRVSLDQGEQECSCRPAVNVLFDSAQQIYGASTIATILTGMGQDGLRGAAAIRQAGGYVIAQDKETSVVWGMPGAVVGAGLANETLPINRIVHRVLTLLAKRAMPQA